MSEQPTKVKLPKDVAEAIESVKEDLSVGAYYDISYVHSYSEHRSDLLVISDFLSGAEDELAPMYFSALVNGYEVERTPEEELREYYDDSLYKYDAHGRHDKFVRGAHHGKAAGVRETLDILGITVEGINGGSEEWFEE